MSVTEEELIMKSQIYLQILASQNSELTIDTVAEQLNDPIEETGNIESFIKKSLRDCLLQLGEIASIKQNLEIKSLKELMEQNTNIIEGLKIQNPVKVEECTSDNIEECKQKLQQYKQQLQEMVSKAKTITEEKQAEVNNMNNENIAIKELSEKLKALDMENLDNIDLSVENLPQEEQDKVALIMDTLKQIKEGKAKQDSSQKEIIKQEKLLKEQEEEAAQLQKQATEYDVQTQIAMDEAEKLDDDPEEEAIEQDLQEELNAAEDTELKKQLTGTGEVDVKAKTQAFDKTAEKVEGEGLVDTDAAMQEQLEKKPPSDDTAIQEVGSFEEETEALEAAQKQQTDKTQPPVVEKETPDDESKTGELREDGNRMGGRNKKSRKNRKSSKKKSKKNRK
jgi:hypothetical protein